MKMQELVQKQILYTKREIKNYNKKNNILNRFTFKILKDH